jgi:hypothetical protein
VSDRAGEYWWEPLGIDPVIAEDELLRCPNGLIRRVTAFVDLVREAGLPDKIYVTSYLRDAGIHATGRAIDIAHSRAFMAEPEVRAAWSRASWAVNLAYPYDGLRPSVVYRVLTGTPEQRVKHPDWDFEHLCHAHIQTPEVG